MSAGRQQGFTLMEMVVAIAIGAVVVVFAALFITAPVEAYEAHSRRVALVADASSAWPRMQQDIRRALPNSVRARRNGNFVALEMLETMGFARYTSSPAQSFNVAGTARGIFGNYSPDTDFMGVHLSVNNPDEQAYTQTVSMTPAIGIDSVPTVPGEATLTLTAVPAINTNSPRNRVYLVRGPVSYLCSETQGTLWRYSGYTIAANQASRDTPGEFAGAAAELIATGLASCDFTAPVAANRPQVVSVRLTTTRASESVSMLHTAVVENLP
jgi:MSHA biogenesis protein MshO